MGMKMQITLSEVTIDQLYDDLSKLREVGFGGCGIEWHTSRSHIGTSITMTLMEPAADGQAAGVRSPSRKHLIEPALAASSAPKAEKAQ